ncbi:hypothetical protein [Collimonas fungivorans]|nr:hypothetical protein [Collimonas fungivorans]
MLFIDGSPLALPGHGREMPSAAAPHPAVKSPAAYGQSAAASLPASPFSAATAVSPVQEKQAGPAEQMLDLPTLEQRWANDPHRDEKIRDVIAVTQMQDRIAGLGETLPKLAPDQQHKAVMALIGEMQAFAARGVLPKSQVDGVASQLMAAIDPKNKQRTAGQPQ